MKLDDKMKSQIIENEKILQNPKQISPNLVDRLLADDYIEIGQSGRIWHKSQILDYFNRHQNRWQMEMMDEEFKQISDEVILLTYKLKKVNNEDSTVSCSSRSSLWKITINECTLIFHQGTPINNLS